jgi:hypothetical protein
MAVNDTSANYDDLVGYKAPENKKVTLSTFFGEAEDTKHEIKPKPVDPDYPEDWQNLHVNFFTFEDYVTFMKLIDEAPLPKLKTLVYKKDKDDGILDFFGE